MVTWTRIAGAESTSEAAFPPDSPPSAPASTAAPAASAGPLPAPTPAAEANPAREGARSASSAPVKERPPAASLGSDPARDEVYEPPPPPAPPAERKSSIPPFSLRVDPFNWIMRGQLGFELEVGVTKWLSVEAVPMFAVDETPPWLKLGGGDSRVYQRSAGLGPLAGATLGVGFWPRSLFKGYVVRAGFSNHALEYETKTDGGKQIDFVAHTRRQLYLMFGSLERWGAFTLGGGLGLGYDLNRASRCISDTAVFDRNAAGPGNCDEIQIAVPVPMSKSLAVAAVTPFTYPWELLARISFGVTID